MQGTLLVTYSIICENDHHLEVLIEELLKHEKIVKLLKSEFLKGVRNLEITSPSPESKIILKTQKEFYTFEAQKKDFADLIELAEEDAKERKLFKKGCEAIQIIDFVTL